MRTGPSVLLWLACAVVFGTLLAWAEHSRNPKDNPDPARQRGVYLHSPRVAPAVIPGFPRPGKRLAVIFVRSARDGMLFHDLALQSDITSLGDLVIVTADGSVPDVRQGLEAVVADRTSAIVRAYGLDRPRDGGYPVGYALVDRKGFLRYSTLDPHCVGMGQNEEIVALLKALP